MKRIVDNFTVKLEPFDASEGEGGHFYIEGNGIRGVQLFYEAGRIVVQINILANYSDFIIAKLILETLGLIFNKQFIDEAGNAIQPNECFTNEMIQELRELSMIFWQTAPVKQTPRGCRHLMTR